MIKNINNTRNNKLLPEKELKLYCFLNKCVYILL